MYLAALFACAASTTFQGPGIDEQGELSTDYPGPFVVAVTHAVPARGKAEAFNAHVEAIEAQMVEMDGFVGYSLRGEVGGRDRWTMSLWESDEALMGFITSGAHIEAMARSGALLDDIDSGTWIEADRGALPPSWREGLDFLDSLE